MYNSYYYGYQNPDYFMLGLLSVYSVLVIAVLVISLIAGWKIFTKAGKNGWATLIPFYRDYVSCQIYWGEGWLFLVPTILFLLSFIPFIGFVFGIASVAFNILTKYKKAEAFGERIGFTIGLVLLPFIFDLILAFSSRYQYHGVPIDAVNYRDIKAKFDSVNTGASGYEAPPSSGNTNVYCQLPPDLDSNESRSRSL